MSEYNKDYLDENERKLSGETEGYTGPQAGSDGKDKRVAPDSTAHDVSGGDVSVDSTDLFVEEILREFAGSAGEKS